MPSSRLILCRPLLLLPPIPPRIRVFSKESTLRMRWPKYWSGHCAKHPQSSFLLPLYLPSGSSLDYFAVLFFISVGHSRALRKEIKTFVYLSLLKLLHSFLGGSVVKTPRANSGDAGDLGSTPGLGSLAEGNGNPLQHSCPGKSHGQRRLAGYSPWGLKESDMT